MEAALQKTLNEHLRQAQEMEEKILPGAREFNESLQQKYQNRASFIQANNARDPQAIQDSKDAIIFHRQANAWLEEQNSRPELRHAEAFQRADESFNNPAMREVFLSSYRELVKGKKRIFLWENEHEVQENIEEYIKILQDIKQESNGKRILLALEFAQNGEVGALPIQFAKEPLRPNLTLLEPYTVILQAASDLEIDIPALDDLIVKGFIPHGYCKMGDMFCLILPTHEELEALYRSPWGVNQRNKQWADYVKAVEKHYPIVVLWAGVGHYDVKRMITGPKEKNTLDIIFGKEKSDQKLQFVYRAWESKGNNASLTIQLKYIPPIVIPNLSPR